jgi:hypothetical protein
MTQRDIEAVQTENLTADWKFGIAYNAALKLGTVLLYAEGYRPENQLAHFRTIQALPLVFEPARKADTDYLEACRVKRNKVENDTIDQATPEQAAELVKFVVELREEVKAWLRAKDLVA